MMDSSPHYSILLRDISEHYPRGTLLQLNKDGSYVGHSHHRILTMPHIRCGGNEVAPLNEVECDLLSGIILAADRYEVYNIPGKLVWGGNIKVGDTVLARLPCLSGHSSSDSEQQHQYTTAIIRWCDKIKYEMGYRYMIGVEITVSKATLR